MSSTELNESCFVFNGMSYSPTWDECYAVRAEEWTGKEMGPNGPTPDLEENVCTDLKGGELKVSAPSSPLPPSPQTPASSTASYCSLPSDRSVRLIPRSGRRWRSPSPAVRAHSSRAGGPKHDYYSNTRPGGSSTSDRFTSGYKRRRSSKKRRYAAASGQHLPAAIPPSHWFQAIGRRLCVDCKVRGWVQNTSWMCVSCKTPLCLVPYRNCFSRWHTRRY